jgi:hypothetical protein
MWTSVHGRERSKGTCFESGCSSRGHGVVYGNISAPELSIRVQRQVEWDSRGNNARAVNREGNENEQERHASS